MKQTTLLIVDDIPQVRQELRQLLPLAGPIRIVGEAADGLEAVAEAERLRPDVVLLDLEMPGQGGLEACRLIKERLLAGAVVILSIYAGPENVRAARAAGADSLVVKGSSLGELMAAILRPGKTEEGQCLPR